MIIGCVVFVDEVGVLVFILLGCLRVIWGLVLFVVFVVCLDVFVCCGDVVWLMIWFDGWVIVDVVVMCLVW